MNQRTELSSLGRRLFQSENWPEKEILRVGVVLIERVGEPKLCDAFYNHEQYGFISWVGENIPPYYFWFHIK